MVSVEIRFFMKHLKNHININISDHEFKDKLLKIKLIFICLLQVQSVRDVAPASDCFPAGQFVHFMAPASLYVFTRHSRHPVSDKYLPAVQGTEIFSV